VPKPMAYLEIHGDGRYPGNTTGAELRPVKIIYATPTPVATPSPTPKVRCGKKCRAAKKRRHRRD
jgi:hypothetical protein